MIPQQIKDVLSKLHAGGFPSAIVAGGAIRDYIFGKPIKDIDVFVSYADTYDYLFPISHFAHHLERNVFKEDWSSYVDIPDVDSVYSVLPFTGELPVQIIVMKPGLSPVERVDQLDFGFCQAYYDGESVKHTWGFHEDANRKTITLIRCENQQEFDRSIIRYERLKQKYPEFTLVIPEKFQRYLPLDALLDLAFPV